MKNRSAKTPEIELFDFPLSAAREGALVFYLNGVDPDSLGGKIITAVFYQDTKRLKKLLSDKRSLPDCCNIFGLTPLMMAAARGYKEGLELILAHPLTSLDRATVDGWTALHFAAAFREKDAARLLLERRAAHDIKNLGNKTAQDIARENGCEEIFTEALKSRQRRAAGVTHAVPYTVPSAAASKEENPISALIKSAREGNVAGCKTSVAKMGEQYYLDTLVSDTFLAEAMKAALEHDAAPEVAGYLTLLGVRPDKMLESGSGNKLLYDDPFAKKQYRLAKTLLQEAFDKVRGGAFLEMILWSDLKLPDDAVQYFRRQTSFLIMEHLKTQKPDAAREKNLSEISFALRVAEEKRIVRKKSAKSLRENFNLAVSRGNSAKILAVFSESIQNRFFRSSVTLQGDLLEKAISQMRREYRNTAAEEMEKALKLSKLPLPPPFRPRPPYV